MSPSLSPQPAVEAVEAASAQTGSPPLLVNPSIKSYDNFFEGSHSQSTDMAEGLVSLP